MTEQEWLTSTDLTAMLNYIQGKISLRKLRLFAVACCRQNWNTLDDRGKRAVVHCENVAENDLPWDHIEGGDENWDLWRIAHLAGKTTLQANLLRDIVGNPWKSITLPYITSNVLAVAHAAYEDRGSVCEGCKGHKHVPTYGPPRETYHCDMKMVERQDMGNCRDGYWPVWCPRCWWMQLPEHVGYRNCLSCYGTGRTGDGILDPDHLAILTDALEDAGYDNEDILDHLRGRDMWTVCPWCVGRDPDWETNVIECSRCDCTGMISSNDKPIHVRGCWVIDLLRGTK